MPVIYGPPESPDNKAIRELRDSVKDLNSTFKKSVKANERFTKILLLVAILQFAIAFLQFITSLFGPVNYLVALVVEIFVGVGVFFAMKSVAKTLGLDWKDKKKTIYTNSQKLGE